MKRITIVTGVSIILNIYLLCYIYLKSKTLVNQDTGLSTMTETLAKREFPVDFSHKFSMDLRSIPKSQTHETNGANIHTTNIDNTKSHNRPVKHANPTTSHDPEQFVYNWNGHTWKENNTVCENLPSFREGILKTQSGDTPIFVHEPSVDKYISQNILISGAWEREVAVAVVSYLQADKDLQFVDIGANIGVISLEIAKLGRRVVAVEPLIDNVQRLCASYNAGHFPADLTIVFNAISDIHEQVALGRDKNNVGGTFVLNNNPNKQNGSDVILIGQYHDLVNTILLDDLLSLLSSDPLTKVVIKLDVEGYEDHVLNGADEFFRQVDVKTVIMEWTYSKQPGTATSIQSFMGRHNMYPYDFNNGPLENLPHENWPPNLAWVKQLRNQ